MIKTPNSYAEWGELLEILKLKENDDDVLKAMLSGTLEWQAGIAERFSEKLISVVNHRMNLASDKFMQDQDRLRKQGLNEEAVVVTTILALRKELKFLAQVVDLPIIPEKDRSHYIELIKDQADFMQQSLEDSVANNNDASGKLASIIRNNRINKF